MKTTTWLILMGVGKWFGYALFGFLADSAGRKISYAGYLLIAAVLVPIYGRAHSEIALLLIGLPVAFFGTGYFSGFSAIAAELFPTEIRATAMGLTYNIGRGFSALAPLSRGKYRDSLQFYRRFLRARGSIFSERDAGTRIARDKRQAARIAMASAHHFRFAIRAEPRSAQCWP